MASVRISIENNKTVFILPDESNLRIQYNTALLEDYYDDEGVVFYHEISRRLEFGSNRQSKFLYSEILDEDGNAVGNKQQVQTFLSDKTGFNRASGGGGGRRTITPSASPFSSITERNTWTTANFAELRNSNTEVTVVTVTGEAVYEWGGEDTPSSYTNSGWMVRQPLNTLRGELTAGRIPVAMADGTLMDTEFRLLDDGSILAPDDFTVESGSIDFGDILVLSEASGFLSLTNNESGDSFALLDSRFTPEEGSFRPRVFHLTEAENQFSISTDASTQITNNNISINYTTLFNAQTNSIQFNGFAASTNVRVRISDVITGVVFKYFPTEASWIDGTDGVDFPVGVGMIDFGDSPLRFAPNRQLTIDIQAETINVMGSPSGVPQIIANIQRAEFRDMAYLSDVTSNDVAPSVHNLSIDIPSRVDLNTDLNVQHTITYSITNRNRVQSLELIVTNGTNQTITIPSTDGQHTANVTLAGIDTSTQGSVAFQLRATETDGTTTHDSNTVTISVRDLPEHEQAHIGWIISTDNASDIDFTTDDILARDNFAGEFTVSGIPNDANLYRIYIAVPVAEGQVTRVVQSGFDITSQFTNTSETFNTEDYNVFLMNANAAVDERYNGQILNVS